MTVCVCEEALLLLLLLLLLIDAATLPKGDRWNGLEVSFDNLDQRECQMFLYYSSFFPFFFFFFSFFVKNFRSTP